MPVPRLIIPLTLAAVVVAEGYAGLQARRATPETDVGLQASQRAEQPKPTYQRGERDALIARARVWRSTEIKSIDLSKTPPGKGAFPAGGTVQCTFRSIDLHKGSPKFDCEIPPDDVVKVKYGGSNGEVYGEVAATRLLAALGFGADRMYPVRVICKDCPTLPGSIERKDGDSIFDPATVERKMDGKEVFEEHGWAWPELERVDEKAGGASRAERDALKLLAVFLQHSDNKPVQQRLACLDEPAPKNPSECRQPLMMVNDLGLTFGKASQFNANRASGVNLAAWSTTPVWKDAAACVGNLPKSATGTLENPTISEEGRQFLARLLTELSDAQIHSLFEGARFTLRVKNPEDPRSGFPTIDEWVAAFKQKRDEIVKRHCP
jgi:hypothetical protein